MEIEEKAPTHRLYRDLVNSGVAFGAQRWLATLQRMCERFARVMVTGASPRDIGGGNTVHCDLVISSNGAWPFYLMYCNFTVTFSDSLTRRKAKHGEACTENGEQLLHQH